MMSKESKFKDRREQHIQLPPFTFRDHPASCGRVSGCLKAQVA
jgi:hypothetical protein